MKHLLPLFSLSLLPLLGCAQVSVEVNDAGCSPVQAPREQPADPPGSADLPEVSGPLVIDGSAVRAVYSWHYEPVPEPPWTLVGFYEPNWQSPDAGGAIELPDLQAGDGVLVLAHFILESAHGSGALRIVVQDATGDRPVAGALVEVLSPSWIALDLSGYYTVAEPGDRRLVVQGRAAPGATLYIQAAAQITALHMRP